jgi:hypothetical protein
MYYYITKDVAKMKRKIEVGTTFYGHCHRFHSLHAKLSIYRPSEECDEAGHTRS